ncbi:unnamed protein product [Prunus armeniaca]
MGEARRDVWREVAVQQTLPQGRTPKSLDGGGRCVADLQRMGVNYSMEDKALMLLTSLPSSYKHFRTTLMFGKVTLDFESVVQDIMSHHRMTQHSGENSQGEGLVAKTGE